MIEIVEREFISGMDGQHYYKQEDLPGINDALYARMMGWAE